MTGSGSTASGSGGEKRGLITLDLGVDLRRALDEWCAVRQLKIGAVLRQALEAALSSFEIGADRAPASSKAATEPSLKLTLLAVPDQEEPVRLEIRLTPSEAEAVEAAARLEGFNAQAWVVAAVRAGLVGAPSFGQAQLEALVTSNRLLAQIAIAIAALRRGDAWPDNLFPSEVEQGIRDHVDAASALMAANVRRWTIKVEKQ